MTDRVAHQLTRDNSDIIGTGAQAPTLQSLPDERPRLTQALRVRTQPSCGEPRCPDAEFPGQLDVRVSA
ncbi:hypothetical protein AMK10_31085 [Streptomyces sp. CB02058]|nr:hypothetical protein AMK10_31085 [Streptomyces sp. CB02058]